MSTCFATHRVLNSPSLRRYIGYLREEDLLQAVRARFATVTAHNFTITSVEPHPKDGGVFVRFDYNASDDSDALHTIEHHLRQRLKQDGALPSWLGLGTHAGQVWLVKGTPWTEVCLFLFLDCMSSITE